MLLDGPPMTNDERQQLMDALREGYSVPAGQSEEAVERSWEEYKKQHNLQKNIFQAHRPIRAAGYFYTFLQEGGPRHEADPAESV